MSRPIIIFKWGAIKAHTVIFHVFRFSKIHVNKRDITEASLRFRSKAYLYNNLNIVVKYEESDIKKRYTIFEAFCMHKLQLKT